MPKKRQTLIFEDGSVVLSFVLLLAASIFGFFLHLSEFLLLFGGKDGLNLRSRSLVDLLHLFSLLILSQ